MKKFGYFLFVCFWISAGAGAADYPVRPINLVVPYAPGGLTDLVTRTLSEEVGKDLGQPLILDNRPGAGGRIGLGFIKRAPKDGYTIGVSVPAMLTLPLIDPATEYDPLKDFTYITIAVDTIQILVVNPKLPINSVKELVSYAKDNPTKLNYGTPGAATSVHMYSVILNEKLGIAATHIPYKGESQALNDVLAGNVQYMLAGAGAQSFITSGRVRAIAITGTKRAAALPNTPTLSELGIPVVTQGWVGYIAPAGLPQEIVQRLNRAFNSALRKPQIEKAIADMGYMVRGSSTAEFQASVSTSMEEFGALIRSGKIKVDQ